MAVQVGRPRWVIGVSAVVAVLLGGCDWVSSPEPSRRAQAEECEAAAAAALPDVAPPAFLREALERFLADHLEGSWMIGDTADHVTVGLPPGCDALADRIEARYGGRVVVDRNVNLRPLK